MIGCRSQKAEVSYQRSNWYKRKHEMQLGPVHAERCRYAKNFRFNPKGIRKPGVNKIMFVKMTALLCKAVKY